jgi:catechol 2,3-dioxygenase-like lactoylglutathione lyase family enzyme
MKIHITSVPVPDQAKALAFYTEKLGFVKKHDIAMGEHRWLTVVDGQSDVELLLEPMAFPPSLVYQKQVYEAGIPWTSFGVDDIQAEYARLTSLGVTFRGGPVSMGPVSIATLEDTCGNIIQLVQKPA